MWEAVRLLNGRRLLVLAGVLAAVAEPSPAQEARARMTLALDRAPLTRVLAELTRASGERHVAAGPEAARQLVVLLCQDREPREVRQAITDLLGWTWKERRREEVVVHTLTKPWQLRERERQLRERFFARYASVVRGLVAAAQDSDGNEKPPELLAFMAKDLTHAGLLRYLGSLPERYREEVLAGRPLVRPATAVVGDLGPALEGYL